MAGAIGPFMTGLGRSPLALIRRKPVRLVSGAVCPKCGRGMAEERAMRSGAVAVSTESCCSSCKKGGPCDGDKKKKKRLGEAKIIKLRESPDALRLIQRSLKLDPGNPGLERKLGSVRARTGGDWDQETDDFMDLLDNLTKVIKRLPEKLIVYPYDDGLYVTTKALRNPNDRWSSAWVIELSSDRRRSLWFSDVAASADKKLHKKVMKVAMPLLKSFARRWRKEVRRAAFHRTHSKAVYEDSNNKKRLSELAVPNCTPLTPPDPDCTLAGGWAKEMKRRNLRLIKRKNDSRKKRL